MIDASATGRARLITPAFVLAALSNLAFGLSFSLYLHLPGFLQRLGGSEVEIGILFGVTAATAIAVRPALGRLMDGRGIRRLIIGGGALNVLVCGLYLTMAEIGPWLYVVRVLHGVGQASLFASLFVYGAEIVPPSRRIEGIALFGVSAMLPLGLSGLLGDFLLARSGYPLLFAASVGFALVSLALSLPLREPAREPGPPPRGMLAALTQPDLVPLWLAGTAFSTAMAGPFAFIKTFVVERGVGSVGLFFAAYSAAAIVLRVGFGRLPERVGPWRVLFSALGSMAAGHCLLALAGSASAVAMAGVLCGMGHGMGFPILVAIVATRARPSERGAALSLCTALFDAGILAGGPLLGAVIDLAGYRAMFFTAAGLTTCAVGILAVWGRRA